MYRVWSFPPWSACGCADARRIVATDPLRALDPLADDHPNVDPRSPLPRAAREHEAAANRAESKKIPASWKLLQVPAARARQP
jgi:hypothetical protein